MATVQGQIEETIPGLGVVRTRSTAANNNSSTTKVSTVANYTSRAAMEAYLLTQGYTQATLNLLTMNDLTYAVKLKQDPGII